jgi:hypothetical protein
MKRLRTLLARAIVAALLLLAFSANLASADPGSGSSGGASAQPQMLAFPEDPGTASAFPQDPGAAP